MTFNISDHEKESILTKYNIIKEDDETTDKKINKFRGIVLTKYELLKLKSQGLTPYYFNDKIGPDFGLVKISEPISDPKTGEYREFFILNEDEYEKMVKYVEIVKKTIELSLEKIDLLKQSIPSMMVELKTNNEEKF
jgi:hypothetical protein